MLYKATQTVIEKAPVDAITGNSRNTLAEETLLKTRAGYETMVKIRISSIIIISASFLKPGKYKVKPYFLRLCLVAFMEA
jgi:hypothetical protein